MRRMLVLLAALCALLPVGARAQSDQAGALTCVVIDAAAAAQAGATIVLTREGGGTRPRRGVTDARGRLHFTGVVPGRYTVRVEPSGASQAVEIRLGQRASVLLSSTPSPIEESLQEGATRARSADAGFDVPDEFLRRVPSIDRTILMPLTLAPAVVPDSFSAYGSSGLTADAFALDGADFSDPIDGTPWLVPHQNWIDQARVAAPGAPAREAGFTGIRSATLLRSGTNRLSGLADTRFQTDDLVGDNVSASELELRPQLVPRSTELATDVSAHLGGPLTSEKAWFFAGGRFAMTEERVTGYPPAILPRLPSAGGGPLQPTTKAYEVLLKPTVNAGPRHRVNAFILVARQTVDGAGASEAVTPEATSDARTTSILWNVSLARAMGSGGTLDVRYSGLSGSEDRLPYNGDTPAWYDMDLDVFAVNAPETYLADRSRHQLDAAWSRLLGGSHIVEAGAQLERGGASTTDRYTGGRVILSSLGVPVGAQLWDGLAKESVNTRFSAYVQDTWLAGSRLTVEAGVRIDRVRGTLAHLDASVLSTTTLSPRVGAAYDLSRSGRTILRGHYGWYSDGPKAAYYDALEPRIAPVYDVRVDDGLNPIGTPVLVAPGTRHRMDAGVRQPVVRQLIGGIEQEVPLGMRLSVLAIHRDFDDVIDDVLEFGQGDFVARTIADPGPDGIPGTGDETGTTVTAYSQVTDPLASQYLIANPADAFRTYRGLQVTLATAPGARWRALASWVFSKTTGTIDNVTVGGADPEYDSPNADPRVQPLREGRLTNDQTHVLKAFGLYRAPWGIHLSGAFYFTSGRTFTRTERVRLNQGLVELFVERRGSGRLDPHPRVDARVEKEWTFGHQRISVLVDGFNLANADTVSARIARSGVAYQRPTAIVPPRAFRVGAQYRF